MAQRSNNNRNRSGSSSNRGSDQPLMSQWSETAKDKPFTTAAAAAGAVAAGVFLWSRRNQISDQISRLSDQITDWAEDMRSSSSGRDLAMTGGPNESSAIESSRATMSRQGTSGSRGTKSGSSGGRSNRGLSETGGGNASLGAHSGTGPGGTTGAGPRA